MAEQDIDFFDYVDESRRPPLLNKHLYLSQHNKVYKKQFSFDKRLRKLFRYSSLKEMMITRYEFELKLHSENKKIKSFKIITAN
jgi:hypothetical protein